MEINLSEIEPAIKRDVEFKKMKPGDIGFYTDFANVSTSATPTKWIPELNFGVKTNRGVREVSDFIAPKAPKTLTPYTAYNYRFFPTGNAILPAQDEKNFERGVGGEFNFVSTSNELKAASMRNLGVSMLLERRMGDSDPEYKARNFAYLENLLETVVLSMKINALDAIADEHEWKPSDGDLNGFIEELLQAGGDEIGLDLNRLLFGQKAWSIYHSALGADNNAANFAYFAESPKMFGDRNNVQVMQPAARLLSSAGTYPRFAASAIYGFVQRGMTDDGLSNLMEFSDGRGMERNQFDHPQKQLEIITVSTWTDVAVVVPDGAFKVEVSKE